LKFLVAVNTLLVTAIRRGLYTTILASVLAPVLLLVVLFSLPSTSSLEYFLLEQERQVLVVTTTKTSGDCYSAKLVEGLLVASTSSLRAHILLVSAEPSEVLRTLGLTRGEINATSSLVLPRDVYTALEKPRVVRVVVNNTTRDYTVAGFWSSNIVLLVSSEVALDSSKYACIAPRSRVLLGVIESAESSLLSTAELWILVLSFTYLPVIYTAQKRVVESLSTSLRVLANSGVGPRSLYFSTLTALVALHVLVVLYVCALGVVLVYTAWAALSYFTVLPPPVIRSHVASLIPVELVLGVLVAPITSRGAVKCY
jgi:hypothetical protein